MVYTRQDSIIGQENFVTTTTIKEYTLPKRILSAYKDLKENFQKLGPLVLWTPQKD